MFHYKNCEHISDGLFKTKLPQKTCFIKERFELEKKTIDLLRALKPNFGYDGFGEFLFYRTYSRIKENNQNENWADCVIRVTNGVMSIRKDWHLKNNICWDETKYQDFAKHLAFGMFNMHWLPPGRGLWSMGTDYVYDTGSMSLFNCGFVSLNDIPNNLHWMMDALMNGVGVGFGIDKNSNLTYGMPLENKNIKIIIDDSREGWCDSVKILLESYMIPGHPTVAFDYSLIRKAGLPIKRFGGISSGPGPLIKLHENIKKYCSKYLHLGNDDYSSTMFKADLANFIGCCVVAGNVRRSAEIAIGSIDDTDFLNLKNYEDDKFAYRKEHGWMANDTVRLLCAEDFEKLDEVAESILIRGEPGYLNLMNVRNWGRVGKDDKVQPDEAVGLNPCGEVPLESYETCNLSESIPTRCRNVDEWYDALRYATFYCSTVNLLPTHRQETNSIIFKNRRIGVALMDFVGWKHTYGVCKVTRWMREGYKVVEKTNRELAIEAGIRESIRKTTVKPGGTVPKLTGKSSGIGYPNFKIMKRRVRIQMNSPIHKFLVAHNVPHEKDLYSDNTEVFEFAVKSDCPREAKDVSIWEQAMNIVLVQREWADNAVSNTICFKPKWVLIKERCMCDPSLKDIVDLLEEMVTEFGVTEPDNYYGIWETFDYDCSHKMIADIDDKKIVVKIFEFNPKHEEGEIESVLSSIAPLTKSISMLPHTSEGVYKQMPEEEMTEDEYQNWKKLVIPFDWNKLQKYQALGEKFCDGDRCSV
jgi:ribonucleoside-diphosphate reductase alpha chain